MIFLTSIIVFFVISKKECIKPGDHEYFIN